MLVCFCVCCKIVLLYDLVFVVDGLSCGAICCL